MRPHPILATALLLAACSSAKDDPHGAGTMDSGAAFLPGVDGSLPVSDSGALSMGHAGNGSPNTPQDAGGASDHDAAVSGNGNDGVAAADAGGDLPGWKLVWSDEFDGASGTSPESEHWQLEVKGDGFGNNELEYYTARPENAQLNGQGQLVITAKKEPYMGRDYTSARMTTSGKFEHGYGRYEARMQIPKGQGIWPAFWMLGNDIGSAGWPTCGEIDIMENIGREPSTIHGTIHGPGYSGGNGIGKGIDLAGGAKYADAMHTFAIEWEPDEIRWYMDGTLYQTRTPADLGGKTWVYDHSFFIILNLAVGGQWPGNPDDTTSFPQTLTIDYVRVYDKQ